MPRLEYTAQERAHDIAMLARTYEIRRKLRSMPRRLDSPASIKSVVIEPVAPEPEPRHRLDAKIYAFPLIYPAWVPVELRGKVNPNAPRVNATMDIIKDVAAIAGVNPWEITGPSRFKTYLRPRHFAMWRVSKEQKLSLPEVGRRFGGRDHTTALNALKNVNRAIASGELDPQNPAPWIRYRSKRDA